jgi:hypothetical protein
MEFQDLQVHQADSDKEQTYIPAGYNCFWSHKSANKLLLLLLLLMHKVTHNEVDLEGVVSQKRGSDCDP